MQQDSGWETTEPPLTTVSREAPARSNIEPTAQGHSRVQTQPGQMPPAAFPQLTIASLQDGSHSVHSFSSLAATSKSSRNASEGQTPGLTCVLLSVTFCFVLAPSSS